jgi:hypothetical protein
LNQLLIALGCYTNALNVEEIFYLKDYGLLDAATVLSQGLCKYNVDLYVNKIRMQRKLALDNQLVFRRDVFILQLPVLRYTINSYEFYDLYF